MSHEVDRISDIWKLPDEVRNPILEELTELEIRGASVIPVAIREEINQFDAWVVLSNNSSHCIEQSISESTLLRQPLLIMAREQNMGAKNDFKTFSQAIRQISATLNWKLSSITYWGDQEYEISFAEELGVGHTVRRSLSTY
jgi:hypothetical protein